MLICDFIVFFFFVTEGEVEKHLEDVTGKEGQTSTLTCQFSIPNAKAQWFRNGKLLEPHGRYKYSVANYTQKLSIKDVRPEDQGEYTCKYKNIETTANLFVEGVYRAIKLTILSYKKFDHLLTSYIFICESPFLDKALFS